MKKSLLSIFAILSLLSLKAQSFIQEFDDTTMVKAQGWAWANMSTPIGLSLNGWNPGSNTVFTQLSGTGYLCANYNGVAGAGTINSWLFSPTRNLTNGDIIIFYTRTVNVPTYADRMEVRLSTAGTNTSVGFGVGTFSTVLLDINPTLVPSQYPNSWTKYTLTLTGLPIGGISGKFAFRYYVTNGGPNGLNSDYVGLDSVSYISASIPTLLKNGTNDISVIIFPNPASTHINLSFPSEMSGLKKIKLYDVLGRKIINITTSDIEFIINTNDLINGTYLIKIESDTTIFIKNIVVKK